jgi:hypothetical protein
MNIFFNVVFTLEQIIKIVGLGLKNYAKRRENLFDFAVISMSWVEFSAS